MRRIRGLSAGNRAEMYLFTIRYRNQYGYRNQEVGVVVGRGRLNVLSTRRQDTLRRETKSSRLHKQRVKLTQKYALIKCH